MSLKSLIEKIHLALNGNPEAGVPEVALYVAGLDGKILPEEIEAFKALAAKCTGYGTPEKAQAAFDRAIRGAGYLLALAVPGVSNEDKRIEAFVSESLKVLGDSFTENLETVRFAVMLWTAMAIADNDYAGIEMKAIAALKKALAERYEAATKTTLTISNQYDPEVLAMLNKDTTDTVKQFMATDDMELAKGLLNK